jgi:hypothetical protein
LPRRALQGVLALAVLGGVVFFGLTRTEVGRRQLKQQIEAQFDARFAGTLDIGRLTGNLVGTVYARDVRLRGPGGRPMLTVDSVRTAPHWRSLLQRQLLFREVELVEPRVRAERSASGNWNLARAFRRAVPRDSSGSEEPFALRFADGVVQDGSMRTRGRGAAPRLVQNGWLFDYTDARLSGVDARFSFARSSENELQLDLERFRARLDGQALPVEANGRLALSGGTVALRDARVRLGETRVQGTFSLKKSPETSAAPRLRVDLAESRLDHDGLRRLVPRWPLRSTTTAALEARGPIDALRIRRLLVERGTSALQAEGTVRGLPDTLRFDLQFADSRLTAADLRAVLPGLPERQLARMARLGTLQFSLDAEGRLANPSGDGERALRASTRFDVRTGEAGTLRGTADLARSGRGAALTYDAEVQADNFAAGRLQRAPGPLPSRLTGTLELSGEGTSAGSLAVALEQSTVAGRRLDGLDVELRAASGERLAGTATLRQRGGRTLRLEGEADLSGRRPAYDLTARSERLDLGALLDRDSLTTALTGTARLDGRGASLGRWAGRLRLALDSSTVARGGGGEDRIRRALPPLTSTLDVAAPDEDGPRIALRGDVADLTVTGEAAPTALRALGRLWGTALTDVARAAYRKPYPPEAKAPPEAARAMPPAPAKRQAVRRVLQAAGLGNALVLRADLTLKRPDVLGAIIPALPTGLRDSIALDARLRADGDSLSARGALRASTLRTGRARADGLSGQFRLRGALEAGTPLLETISASVDARADTLGVGTARFLSPALAADYRERAGDVQLSTSATNGGGDSADAGGRLQLEAGLRLLPDRNRLRVRTLRLATRDYVWQRRSSSADGAPPVVDLFADAVVVPGLTLVNRLGDDASAVAGPRTASSPQQRIELRGALSTAPADTLFARAQSVRLRPLSRLADAKRPLGGHLDAEIAWTGGARSSELTGRLDIERFTFDDHFLGRLTAQSRYVPGSPRLAVDARLRPGDPSALHDSTALDVENNRFSISGTVAPPELGEAPRAAPFGTENGGDAGRPAEPIDLTFDAERADLFFLEYILDGRITGVRGAATGDGRIGGSFRDPVFQADLRVADAAFRVPRFGTRYTADGDVTIDREGLHVDGGRVADPDGGSARVDGSLLFNEYEYVSFDLGATLDEFQVIDKQQSAELPFYGQIAASGPARLTGRISDALLRSPGRVRTTPESRLILPIEEGDASKSESGFLIFADSTGRLPDLSDVTRRESILDERPAGERKFVDGLDVDLGVTAPPGSSVRLVFDPLLGDEILAVGSGQIQLRRQDGEFSLFGTLDVNSGSYLFTAGQVFQRRFQIRDGTLQWDGPPGNAQIDLTATYRTRASRAGLPGARERKTGRIPITVLLGISGRVQQPAVDLSLAVDRSKRGFDDYSTAGLETVLNRSGRGSEYATSVLLTNTFLLTTDLAGRAGQSGGQGISETGNRLAFNSVSQLVSSQLNRYLDEAVPGLDVNLGVQGENPQDLDVIYGAALRLLDERLVIRGEGVLDDTGSENTQAEGFEGEFVVEVRLTPNVSAEAFYRREGSLLSDRALTSTTGAGLSYQTEFSTWDTLWRRLFGWLGAGADSGGDDGSDGDESGDAVASGG